MYGNIASLSMVVLHSVISFLKLMVTSQVYGNVAQLGQSSQMYVLQFHGCVP